MVEFLLLSLPLLGLASGTLGVTWYSFARAQLAQVANEAAMQSAEPDSTFAEVFDDVKLKLKTRLGLENFSMTANQNPGSSATSIELPATQVFGPLSLVLPSLGVVGHVPTED